MTDHGTCGSNGFPAGVVFALYVHEGRASRRLGDANLTDQCREALVSLLYASEPALGWTRPKLRTPEAADRWTWLVIAAHTQLRLTRPLAADLRRPWERPAEPGRLTPARVRRGFRNLR